MALKNDPVFAQTPKASQAVVSAANTALDGTGTIVLLLTAGPDGSLVTSLVAWAQVTGTAKRLNLWLSLDSGATWKLLDSQLMSAFTVNNTTVQTPVKFVDKNLPNAAIRLPANAKLGVTNMVAEAVVYGAEYTDF